MTVTSLRGQKGCVCAFERVLSRAKEYQGWPRRSFLFAKFLEPVLYDHDVRFGRLICGNIRLNLPQHEKAISFGCHVEMAQPPGIVRVNGSGQAEDLLWFVEGFAIRF